MAKRQTPAAQRIDNALTENPQIPSRTLARQLYAESPEMWTNQTACLTAIRGIRGAAGKYKRATTSKTTAKRTPEESAACQRWGSLLPEPEPGEFKWHELPEGKGMPERWLILCDPHIPYHDKALTVALAHAEGNCDGVLLLGDIADAYQLSYWERNPTRRRFVEELDAVKQFLDALQELKPKRIVYKAGNHEYRLERYLQAKAPELFDMPQFNWQSFLELDVRGIQWVPAMHPINHHELSLIHGHEWGNRFASPVNPARGAFLKAHDCTVEGHSHRTSHHTEHTLRRRPISCWSIGCLCDLNPEYRPLGNKWNHGFAYLNAGSEWSIENLRIIDGEVK